jgi:hypothetical protein
MTETTSLPGGLTAGAPGALVFVAPSSARVNLPLKLPHHGHFLRVIDAPARDPAGAARVST